MKTTFLICLILLGSDFLISQETLLLQPNGEQGKDSYLSSINNSTNYGNSKELKARAGTFEEEPSNSRGLVAFDLSAIPEDVEIISAKLTLSPFVDEGEEALAGTNAITINRVTQNWFEGEVTWNNQPETDNLYQVEIGASSEANFYKDIDVTDLINDQYDNPAGNFGMLIRLTDEEQYRSAAFASSDHVNENMRPKLVITYKIQDFYYYNGEKQYMAYNKNKVLLKVAADFNSSTIPTPMFEEINQVSTNYYELTFDPTLDTAEKDQILSILKESGQVFSANYFVGLQSALTDEVLFVLKDGISENDLLDVLSQHELTATRNTNTSRPLYSAKLAKSSSLNPVSVSGVLFETGIVEYCEPNYVHLHLANTNDTYYGDQWAIDKSGSSVLAPDLDIDDAWAYSTGSGVIIAVIDDGVDLAHLDLQGNLVPGFNIDGSPGGGNPTGNQAHGTAVAGIIAARANNNLGIAGVAYDAKIMPIRGAVSTEDIADGISLAVNNNADVINMSIGISFDPTNPIYMVTSDNAIKNAVQNGRNGNGCILVASAGNVFGSPVEYPARNENVIAVGFYRHDATIGSNSGTEIDVIAPGEQIATLDISGAPGYSSTGSPATYVNDPDYTSHFNSSSAAAPFVSGIAALILQDHPCLTWEEVRTLIRESTGNTNTVNNNRGYGIVNALTAMDNVYNGSTINGGITCGSTTVCKNSQVTYEVASVQNETYGYTWEADGNVLIDHNSSPIGSGNYSTGASSVEIDFNGKDGGSVTIRVRANNACGGGGNWVSITVPVTKSPVQPTDITVVSGDLCEGSTIVLETTSSSTHDDYTWTIGSPYGSIVTPTNNNFPLNQEEFTVNGIVGYSTVFAVTGDNACGSSPQYFEAITKNSNVPSNYVPTPILPSTYCTGYNNTFTLLNPLPGVEYQWTFDDLADNFDDVQSAIGLTSYTPNFGTVNNTNQGAVNAYVIWVRAKINCGAYSSWSTVYEPIVTYSSSCGGSSAMAVPDEDSDAAVSDTTENKESINETEVTNQSYNGLVVTNSFDLQIYPNPSSSGLFNLTVPNFEESLNVQILDIYGKLVSEFSMTDNQTMIDLSTFSKGMYFVQVVDDTFRSTQKIIFE